MLGMRERKEKIAKASFQILRSSVGQFLSGQERKFIASIRGNT